MEILLGGGLFTSAASFLYPILRYLVPPSVPNLGGDDMSAEDIKGMVAYIRSLAK